MLFSSVCPLDSQMADSLSAVIEGRLMPPTTTVEKGVLNRAKRAASDLVAPNSHGKAKGAPVGLAGTAWLEAQRGSAIVNRLPLPPLVPSIPMGSWLGAARRGELMPPPVFGTREGGAELTAGAVERRRISAAAATAGMSEASRREHVVPYDWKSSVKRHDTFPSMRGKDSGASRASAARQFELVLSAPAAVPIAPSAKAAQKILRAIECTSLADSLQGVQLGELSASELPLLKAEPPNADDSPKPSLRSVMGSGAYAEKLQKLNDLINIGLDNATADGHRGRRHTGVKAFRAFCEDVLGVSPDRPLDPLTSSLIEKLEEEWLCMQFVCALVQDRGISPSSASVYFSAVQGWHGREHGVKLCAGLKLERLPQMLKGLRRVIGEVPRAIRRGIAPDMLKRAMDLVLDPSRPDHANMRAALAVALQGLLRSAEYCGDVKQELVLMRSDLVELTERRAVIMMHPCKNMHHLGGKTCPLVLGAGGQHIDCVWELNNLMQVDPIGKWESASETPLFRDPRTNRQLSYDTMLGLVKTLMSAIGEDPGQFGTHSLRIGGATALFSMGASETLIRTMGRWSSDLHRLYTRACFEQCEEWSRKAGSAEVSDIAGTFDEVDFY